ALVIELYLETQMHFDSSLLVSHELKNWTIASAMVSRKRYQFAEIIYDLAISPKDCSVNIYEVTDIASGQIITIKVDSISVNSSVLNVDGLKRVVQFKWLQQGQLHCSVGGRSAFFKDQIILDGAAVDIGGGGRVLAPMHGLLLDVLVQSGDQVIKGQTLAVLEAMKMHYEIQAEIDGTVGEVTAVRGKQVATDDVLLEINENE
ncbi:MAG: 3-methylcrotonyl-CoA carboxylase, partial [Porticoccaceae bacterium]|nr:3-methylcrotonyl-CoA carboxylase [Porticoccaceae bacterium]